MTRFQPFILFFLLLPAILCAQGGAGTDADTLLRRPATQALVKRWALNDSTPLHLQIMQHQPYFGFTGERILFSTERREAEDKDLFFYVLTSMVLLFALLKLTFPKYLSDLRRLFFRTTLKQRQLREQLIQTPLPSLLFNIFFVIVGGLYAAFLFDHAGMEAPVDNFWLLALYSSVALSAIYLVKYIGLKIMGWLFSMSALTDAYIFIVFLINKVAGIFLLPFIVLVAFTRNEVNSVCWMISWTGLGLLYLYRYILAWGAVRNHIRFSIFHFFLYVIALEITPLLLIYKAILFIFK